MTTLEQKIVGVATTLLMAGTTTTLDIKNECRRLFPNDKFYQADVSEVMDIIAPAEIKNLGFNNNGKYREYFINAPAVVVNPQVNTIPTSKKGMVKLLKSNLGKFFGITFIKKDGTQRTLNAHMKKDNFMDDLGYLNVVTNTGDFKLIDPKKILEITINGSKYVAK